MTVENHLERQSNIELLRILSMLMVIGLHCNFVSLGKPSPLSLYDNSSSECIRILIENICLVSVNAFILISGYFGIRLKKEKVFRYLFQVFFFASVILFFYGIFLKPMSLLDSMKFYYSFFSFNWFVPAYLGLMLLSPIITSAYNNVSVKIIQLYVLLFFMVDVVFGFILLNIKGIGAANGYSVFHLLFIYSVGRLLNALKSGGGAALMNANARIYVLAFIFVVLLNSLFSYYCYCNQCHYWNPLAYNNPLVIFGSVILFLAFANINVKSKAINRIASSAFSAFLIHANILVYPLFIECNRNLYVNHSGVSVLILFVLFIISIYTIAFLIDQVQIRSSKWLVKMIFAK